MNTVPFDLDARYKAKMNSLDRVIVLEPMEDAKTLSASGEVDMRLFKGENNLHAIYDIQKGLWFLRYEKGIIPEAMKQMFSEFQPLLDFVRVYFQKRNVRVTEVRM